MSRFVSAGTDEEPTERDEAWLKAQEQIEATRRSKMEAGRQEGGKSLYETLQANKAAKQDAFEESIRLRNQFRSLDEDEVEFLDSILESTRAKEAAVKKETAEEIDAFRKQQEEAERVAKSTVSSEAPDLASGTSWAVSKKRKKGRDDILGVVKLRKSSAGGSVPTASDQAASAISNLKAPGFVEPPSTELKVKPTFAPSSEPQNAAGKAVSLDKQAAKPLLPAAAPSLGLGLGAYSSDDED